MLFNEMKIIYSLFDFTGNWSEPYRRNGYDVRQIDLKHGQDIRWLKIPDEPVYGILAAPPCTDFASSGAQYWKEKDQNGRTLKSLELIGAMARFILACDYMYNLKFWVVENPVGRLNKWFGKPKYCFQPYWFGDGYKKLTCLWGRFRKPKVKLSKYVENPITNSKGHAIDKYLGIEKLPYSERKDFRSITPLGFAWAFYEANK